MKHLVMIVLFAVLNSPLQALEKDIYPGIDILSDAQIKGLLGDYPALGSIAGQKDLDTLLKYQDNRTEKQCDYAASQESISLSSLFVINKGPLSEREAMWLQVRLAPMYAEAGYNIFKAKELYKRPRPYDSHSELNPCIPRETSYAYPSGHTALGRALARVLSEIHPERSVLFMKRSNEISENRMIGGVHYPSDIIAGKILGDEIADVVVKSKFFDQFR